MRPRRVSRLAFRAGLVVAMFLSAGSFAGLIAGEAAAQSKRETAAFINGLFGRSQLEEKERSDNGRTRERRVTDARIEGNDFVCTIRFVRERRFRGYSPWDRFRRLRIYRARLRDLDPKKIRVDKYFDVVATCAGGGRCFRKTSRRTWEDFATCAGGRCRRIYRKKVKTDTGTDDSIDCGLDKDADRARLTRALRHLVRLHGGITVRKGLFKN